MHVQITSAHTHTHTAHSPVHTRLEQVDTLLRSDPPSVEHVLNHSLHFLPPEVLDAPPRAEPSMEDALRGRLSAMPAPEVGCLLALNAHMRAHTRWLCGTQARGIIAHFTYHVMCF